jgi:hypothetical protein
MIGTVGEAPASQQDHSDESGLVTTQAGRWVSHKPVDDRDGGEQLVDFVEEGGSFRTLL